LGWRRTAAALSIGFCLTATPGYAHAAFGNLGPFWLGTLHIFVSPLAIATLAAFGAALGFAPTRAAFPGLIAAAVCAAFAVSSGRVLILAAPLGAIVAGCAGALGLRTNVAAALAVGCIAGFGAGLAADVDQPDFMAALGAAFSTFLLVGAVYALFDELEPRLPAVSVARRVIAAWAAAIGLLLGALSALRI
jgi:hypothetical protein